VYFISKIEEKLSFEKLLLVDISHLHDVPYKNSTSRQALLSAGQKLDVATEHGTLDSRLV